MNYLKLKSPLKYKTIFKTLLILFISAVVFIGCKKPEDIGQKVVALPGEKLNVHFTDTVSIISHSFLQDSIQTKSASEQLLGGIFDPVFGSTSAGIYTQFRLDENNLDFGSNPKLDSIVLGFDYAGFYGDTSAVQHIKVYRLEGDMSVDSVYFSNSSVQTAVNPIFDKDVVFDLKDSVVLVGGKVRPHLRLRLDPSFGDDILSKSGQVELSNNESFLKFMKGLYVVAGKKDNGGGLAYMDLNSIFSQLTLYYHNDDKDSLFKHFVINRNCAFFSTFNHFNYQNASTEFKNQVILKDSSLGDNVFYLQPTGGVRTYLNFPYLKNFISQHQIAIQQANLIVNIDPSSDTTAYPAPKRISVVGINEKGQNIFLTDYYEGGAYYGGQYEPSKNQYVFNITHSIQELLLGTSKVVGFRLIISGEAVLGNRAILQGNKAGSRNTRLRLYYTDVIP